MSGIRDIFLDLDGTLTDPKPGITGCIQHALRELGADVPHADELEWCIGPSLWHSFGQMLGQDGPVDEAIALYRERYTDTGLFENAVYDGVPEMMQRLAATGARLHLATAKPHVYARRITAHFGLADFMEFEFGSELDGTRVDKADLLAHALEETGARPETSLMIGDREHDAIAAKANGIKAWGVLYGYGTREELQKAGVAALFAEPGQIAL